MNINWARDGEKLAGSTHNVTLKSKCDEGTGKIKLDGGNATYEKEIHPTAWTTNDYVFGLKFIGKSVPAKTQFNWTTEGRFGIFNLHKDLALIAATNLTCGTDKKLIGAVDFRARIL